MDVIVQGDGKRRNTYWMRSQIALGEGCTGVRHRDSSQALAVVFYDNAPTTAIPTSTPYTYPDPCLDAPISQSEPIFKLTPDPKPATTFEMNVGLRQKYEGGVEWTMNDSSFRVNFSDPALLAAHNGRLKFPEEWNLYNTNDSSSTRFVVINNTPSSHPMHIHGEPTPHLLFSTVVYS